LIPFPTDSKVRKEIPVTTGVFDYFPNALAEVARISYYGNQKHNPGQPLHWSRGKSNDHPDCMGRHLLERGTLDENGQRHSAMLAWRALANLQIELEDEAKAKLAQEAILADAGKTVVVFNVENPDDVSTIENILIQDDGCIVPIGLNNVTFLQVVDPLQAEPAMPVLDVTELDPRGSEDLTREDDKLFLELLGCKPTVVEQIIGGTVYAGPVDEYVYVAGPMRGYDKFNFPAFDATRDVLLQNGRNVISPADIDRASGCDENTPPAQVMDQRVFVFRDFFALFFIANRSNGAIAMIPGWEKSTGAAAEFMLSRWLGLTVFDQFGVRLKSENVDYTALNASIEKFLNAQQEN
jgi:hypothetical protein